MCAFVVPSHLRGRVILQVSSGDLYSTIFSISLSVRESESASMLLLLYDFGDTNMSTHLFLWLWVLHILRKFTVLCSLEEVDMIERLESEQLEELDLSKTLYYLS